MGIQYTQEKVSNLIGQQSGLINKYIFTEKIKEMYNIEQSQILQKIFLTLLSLFLLAFPTKFALSKKDSIKPELYSPTLSMISFVLVKCYLKILKKQEILPQFIFDNLYKAVIISIINILVFKVAYKSIKNKGISILKTMAFCNTKFITMFFYSILTLFIGQSKVLSTLFLVLLLSNYLAYIY